MRSSLLFTLMLVAAPAFAQLYTGIRAGVPLTDFFSAVSNPSAALRDQSKRYIFGPTIEVGLPKGFGIEFDVLYRRVGSFSVANVVDPFTTRARANAWEFPLLVKYKFGKEPARPYVSGGVAFNHLSGFQQVVTRPLQSVVSNVGSDTGKGFVLGVGINIKAVILHIAPEIRYTRWGAENFADFSGRRGENQAEFLLGFTF